MDFVCPMPWVLEISASNPPWCMCLLSQVRQCPGTADRVHWTGNLTLSNSFWTLQLLSKSSILTSALMWHSFNPSLLLEKGHFNEMLASEESVGTLSCPQPGLQPSCPVLSPPGHSAREGPGQKKAGGQQEEVRALSCAWSCCCCQGPRAKEGNMPFACPMHTVSPCSASRPQRTEHLCEKAKCTSKQQLPSAPNMSRLVAPVFLSGEWFS